MEYSWNHFVVRQRPRGGARRFRMASTPNSGLARRLGSTTDSSNEPCVRRIAVNNAASVSVGRAAGTHRPADRTAAAPDSTAGDATRTLRPIDGVSVRTRSRRGTPPRATGARPWRLLVLPFYKNCRIRVLYYRIASLSDDKDAELHPRLLWRRRQCQ